MDRNINGLTNEPGKKMEFLFESFKSGTDYILVRLSESSILTLMIIFKVKIDIYVYIIQKGI